MTLENTNFGSEYGIEVKGLEKNGFWVLVNKLGEGFETYEETYQSALTIEKELGSVGCFRVVVYDYDSSERKNIRILTVITKIDTLTKIAGWEEASILGDDSFDLYKKVRQIYQEELDNMKGG